MRRALLAAPHLAQGGDVRNVLAGLAAVMICGVAAGQDYRPPRTPDGHADFQGVWTQRWITPLERLPESPALKIEEKDEAAFRRGMFERYLAGDPLQAQDDYDPLDVLRVGGELRSSLIVDPPDGLLPYTAEGK